MNLSSSFLPNKLKKKKGFKDEIYLNARKDPQPGFNQWKPPSVVFL